MLFLGENKLICWSYPSKTGTNSDTQNDKILVYHYESNRWSLVIIDHEYMIDYQTPGYTLEELDDFMKSYQRFLQQKEFESGLAAEPKKKQIKKKK